jgi:hypothetical protein
MAPFDAISTKGVIKPLFDIPEASYIRWYDMTKVVNDSITELDIWAKDVTKPFSHSTTESDIWTKDITKPFTDEFISSEQKILDLFKPKADSAPVDDINSKDVDKILLDSIAQTDEYRVLDYIKPFEETSLPTDSSVFGVSKSGLIDTVTIVSVDGNGTLSDYRYSFEGYDSELYAESYKAILFS